MYAADFICSEKANVFKSKEDMMPDIFMRFPGGKRKALTLSYDDGVEQDIRLIEIMQKHHLKGTFNLNSGRYASEDTVYPKGTIQRRMTRQQVSKIYKDSGMEVAVHGFSHPCLDSLPVNLCINDVIKDRENLETQFETIIRGMAYPYGSYSNEVIECLKCAGIAYSRTVNSSGDFSIPTDWLRWETTCHHNDSRLMELAKKFITEDVYSDPWLFYLWGHSYEFELNDNWNIIERFAEYISCKEDIWYATNIEIYEYVEAYRRLVYSMDGCRVFNPTAFVLWLEKNSKLYCVNPKEIIYV